MVQSPGSLFWFTGLAGAGKSTLGKLFYQRFRMTYPNTFFLDGDTIREVFGNDLGYSLEDRRKSALRNISLCKILTSQGIHVICSTISMFEDLRKKNRETFDAYVEIYVKVSKETLIQRDQKGIYSSFLKGEIKEVVGLDLPFEEPIHADFVIDNEGKERAEELIERYYESIRDSVSAKTKLQSRSGS